MQKTILLFLFHLLLTLVSAQPQLPLDYQLRLEPVWSRVADALGEAGSVESVEFSSDGRYIISGAKYDYSVVMWRASDGQELWRAYTEQEVERVGWSADNKYVAAASEDYLVTVFDSSTGEKIKVLNHQRGIDGLTWSNKGTMLVTGEEKMTKPDGGTSGNIRVFQFPSGKEVRTIDFGNTVNELFFSDDDNYLLAVGHGHIKVYRVADWELIQTLTPGYFVTFTTGVFSPDAKYVFAAGQGGTSRGNCYLWDWQKGELVKMFNHTGKKIESVLWHPNGEYILYAGHDPYIHVYRFGDIVRFGNDEIPLTHKVWAGDHAEYLDFNADGSFLVSAHQNGLIKLWVWMGENSDLNSQRHRWILSQQKE